MRKNFADTRNISAVLAKAGVPERPPTALGRGTVRKDDFAVTENTLIWAVLARAGLPLRPPAALGRASWLDVHVQTVGQLSAALRAEAAHQRGAAPGRTSLLDLQNVGQLSAALRAAVARPVNSGQLNELLYQLQQEPKGTRHGVEGKPQEIYGYPYSPKPVDSGLNERLFNELVYLLPQEDKGTRHDLKDKPPEIYGPTYSRKQAKLAALLAMIAALQKAINEAFRRGDFITCAVLNLILAMVQAQYDREAQRPE